MNNTKEAIKYGLSVMNVTPKEMFALIESSNGYTGEDNNRWLTAQIIKIAEKDGVGYSQLLAKWFNIISSIEEECSDMSFKDKWVSHIKSLIGDGAVYTVGMGEENDFGAPLDEVNWFSGVDIPWNTMFTDEFLPSEVSTAIKNGEPVTLFLNMKNELQHDKGSSLAKDAKVNCVACNDASALLLYRMCNMLSAMEDSSNFKVVILSDTSFLLNKDNSSIIKYFLNNFEYEGFVANSRDLYTNAFTSTDFAVMVCTARIGTEHTGIVLPKIVGDGSSTVKRYSYGGNMADKVFQTSLLDDTYAVLSVNKALELGDPVSDMVNGHVNALGYICRNAGSRESILSSLPIKGTVYAPITMDNLSDVIVYYGVSESLHSARLQGDIPEILSGHPEYDALVANCVPVFLFGLNSNFRDYGSGLENHFDVETSELAKRLLDRAAQYFSFETKNLVDICKGFLDYLKESGEDTAGKTFAEIRALSDSSGLNTSYIEALNRCMGYICTQYRRM
jgi:hypothetical protein